MKYADLTGRQFGRLTVVKMERCRFSNAVKWTCLCTCGITVRVVPNSLNKGQTRSCGCLMAETRKMPNQLRGTTGHDL